MENREASRITLLASAAQTASGSAVVAESVGEFREALVTLNCTAASGTSPTLNVLLQTSDDGGVTWYNLPNAAFTQLTAVGSQVLQLNVPFGDTLKVVWTIGGTTPSFTFAVKAVLKG